MRTLVLYNHPIFPTRKSIWDHLYSFGKYHSGAVYYHNAALSGFPGYLKIIKFDSVIFHNTFLSKRADDAAFSKLKKTYAAIQGWESTKIALPQDEFFKSDSLSAFIIEYGVDHVFSVSPSTEWQKIYRDVDRNRVDFHEVLTGYLDDATVDRIDRIVLKNKGTRPVDIGYRAWQAPQWLGRHGFLKTQIAEVFKNLAHRHGFSEDISVCEKDTLYGDDWLRFLASCRFTIGVEGGASVLDRTGEFKRATEAYVKEHPKAEFDEIEAACFPGEDGYLSLFAISPRHFEAVAAKTCQVLVEGYYSGVLKPGVHYIEVKQDMSNLDEVAAKMKDRQLVDKLVKQVYDDVIRSEKYSYAAFVSQVMDTAGVSAASDERDVWWRMNRLLNRWSWYKFFFLTLMYKLINRLFSTQARDRLVSLYRRV